jgi:hypothetical protein
MTKARWIVLGMMAAMPAVAITMATVGAGCSSSTATQPAEGGAGGGSEAGPDGAAMGDADANATLTLSWLVAQTPAVGIGQPDAEAGAEAPEAGTPQGGAADGGDAGNGVNGIPGVKVCVDQHAEIPCVMTAADGTFALPGLPPATDIVVTFEKSGYGNTIKAIETARTDMQDTNPIFMFLSTDPDPAIGVAVDRQNKGMVVFFAIGPDPDGGNNFAADMGATVTLSPAGGNGPFFLGNNNAFVLSATTTQAFFGAYYNLDPGTYTLTVNDPNNDCAPVSFPFGGWGYPVPPNSVKFPIRAGTLTDQVGVLCTKKSAIVKVDSGAGGG